MCHEIKMRSFKVGRTCSKHDPLMERGRKADQRGVCWLSYNSWVSHGWEQEQRQRHKSEMGGGYRLQPYDNEEA